MLVINYDTADHTTWNLSAWVIYLEFVEGLIVDDECCTLKLPWRRCKYMSQYERGAEYFSHRQSNVGH